MADVIMNIFPKSTYEFLASHWLQQQDLHGKSAVEVADMYYSALMQIRKKYARPKQTSQDRQVWRPDFDSLEE